MAASKKRPGDMTGRELARHLELAVLSPETTRALLDEQSRLGRRRGMAAVRVRPSDLRRCAESLDGGRTAAGTVVGFPHGGSTRAVKVQEAREAIEDAQSVLGSGGPPVELAVVVNAGQMLSGDWGAVRDEIQAVLDVTHARGGLLGAMFEPALIGETEVRRLCELCADLKVDAVVAGTGFGPRNPNVVDIRLLRSLLPEGMDVQAAGAIDSLEDARALFDAGAARLITPQAIVLLDDAGR